MEYRLTPVLNRATPAFVILSFISSFSNHFLDFGCLANDSQLFAHSKEAIIPVLNKESYNAFKKNLFFYDIRDKYWKRDLKNLLSKPTVEIENMWKSRQKSYFSYKNHHEKYYMLPLHCFSMWQSLPFLYRLD